ncbi:MAG: methyltransferase domain-containing protein [Rhizobiaceae bacterium]
MLEVTNPARHSVTAAVKQHFGEEIRALAGLHGSKEADRVIEAFKSIPRELFAGPGPWSIMSALRDGSFEKTSNSDPAHLYHCVLISLDRQAGINIGEPSLWARNFAALDIPHGAQVLQVGGGSGYYSAILAHLAGASGRVIAFEIDASVARIGSDAVSKISNLDFRIGDATTGLKASDGPFDFIVAFAGVTHPVKDWLDRLSDNGAMLLPVTGSGGWGAMCVFRKVAEKHFQCETIGSCGFYRCQNARDENLEAALDVIWSDRARLSGWQFQMSYDETGVRYEADGQILTAPFS